jgi:hypothetical protein
MNFVLDVIVRARRTREAIRQIKSIPTTDRDRKMILASWFQEHTRAAPGADNKRRAYDQLLGREGNSRIMG